MFHFMDPKMRAPTGVCKTATKRSDCCCMDYNDLALFTRVVERGSFSDAARAAGLPKSSVTRGIARLEKELGVRLIQRTTRQRGVTDAGRELYERVRTAVGALEDAAVRSASTARSRAAPSESPRRSMPR